MTGSLLLILSYGLVAVFVVGFVARGARIARLPLHLRWELAPVPKEKGRGRYGGSYLEEYEWWKRPREESTLSELLYMGKEIVFLKALWEHNRALWWFSYPFHLGLYLLMGAGGLLVLGLVLSAVGVSALEPLLAVVLPVLALAGNGLGALGVLGLLGARVSRGDLRAMTTRVAYFNLLLLLGVFGTGLAAAWWLPDFVGGLAAYAGDLFTAQPPVAVSGLLAAHVLLILVFLAYLPFSQMMHFVAKYFTYHQVRWDDQPMVVGSSMERKAQELLAQPVTWSGPHVGANGKKNWVDITTKEAGS